LLVELAAVARREGSSRDIGVYFIFPNHESLPIGERTCSPVAMLDFIAHRNIIHGAGCARSNFPWSSFESTPISERFDPMHDLPSIWNERTNFQTARKQASLSKRILFLSRTKQVFNLWHVIHRPFSYSFAILAILHIGELYT
jgi:hypothetical protein